MTGPKIGAGSIGTFLQLAFGSQLFFLGQFIGKGEMIALGTLRTLGRRRLLPAAALESQTASAAPGGRATVTRMDAPSRSTEFAALGQPGFENLAGLETFPNPGVSRVELTSDELTAICPVTGQPDLYVAAIEYQPGPLCIESKSLKLYLHGYRNEGHFCEALAVRIRDDVANAVELPAEKVRVTLKQKSRGGITITATS